MKDMVLVTFTNLTLPNNMRPDKPIPWSGTITNIQGKVLESLAKFKFLTLTQMLEIGVGTGQYKYLWKQVASMRDRRRKLVDRKSFNTEDRLGRVEDFYFLTQKGRETLILEFRMAEEEIRMPFGGSIAYKDYHHRKSTIDFHLKLCLWAKGRGAEVTSFATYFDKEGNNRSGKNLNTLTKIDFGEGEYIIPDAAFKLKLGSRERLFLFEMHNGADTMRLMKQLHQHAQALVMKHTHKKFGYDPMKSYTTLLLFENRASQQSFINRVLKEGAAFSKVQKFFLCKNLEELTVGKFGENWETIFGDDGLLFD